MIKRQVEILLVEDNQDDVELTLHALKKENLANNITWHAMVKKLSTFCSATEATQIAPSTSRRGWFCWT
jgi:hypothetical protein